MIEVLDLTLIINVKSGTFFCLWKSKYQKQSANVLKRIANKYYLIIFKTSFSC